MSELTFTSFGTKTDFFGDFFGTFKVRKLTAHEVRLVNDDGSMATMTGSFLIQSFKLAEVTDVSKITFTNEHRQVTAQLTDIADFDSFHSLGKALVTLTKSANSYIGTIGNDIMSAWGGEADASVYSLAGDDTILVRSLRSQTLLDGGLGKDVLNFSKMWLDSESSEPDTGLYFGMEGSISTRQDAEASFSHFEKVVGTRYGDTFECGDADTIFFTAGAGDDAIYGGYGKSKFNAGTGTDEIYGGDGAQKLVFGIHSDTDYFFDFEAGVDKIVIQDNLGFKNFNDLKDFTMSEEGYARIDFGAGEVLEIYTVDNVALTENDFIF